MDQPASPQRVPPPSPSPWQSLVRLIARELVRRYQATRDSEPGVPRTDRRHRTAKL